MSWNSWRPRPGEEPRTVGTCRMEIGRIDQRLADVRRQRHELELASLRERTNAVTQPIEAIPSMGDWRYVRRGELHCERIAHQIHDLNGAEHELARQLEYYRERLNALERPQHEWR